MTAVESYPKIEVSQRAEFSCCYVMRNLPDTITKTSYKLNAHHYRFEATVVSIDAVKPKGIVISFEDLKSLINSCLPDGGFLFNSTDINQVILAKDFKECGIKTFDFGYEMSAELLLEHISLLIIEKLKVFPTIFLKEAKLRENSNSYVTWKANED